jgi:hypothetical protein
VAAALVSGGAGYAGTAESRSWTKHAQAQLERQRADETALTNNEDRASRQPIAASFGAAVLYRGFDHWYRFPYAFLP